jgi:ABC-type branched-subunit amino acid transport system substrate-binding protein
VPALLVALAGTAIGCGTDEATGDPSLTVYVSTPLSGRDARDGLAVADGARAALAAAGEEAGGVAVEVAVLDSGPGASATEPTPGRADPVRAAANAREATEDSTAIAYIGELDSETTRTSLPITNDARLLQISPLAGDPGLVAEFEGSDELPVEVQPSGSRTFGTLATLDGSTEALGAEAMDLVLDSIGRADDPFDRASVVEAFLATGERDSPLGTYSIDELGRADLAG